MRGGICLQRILILQTRDHRHVDRILVFGARCQRPVEDEFVPGFAADRDGIAERQLVLRQRPGLVRAQDVDTRQLLDGCEPADDSLPRGKTPCAHGHGHGQNRGHGDGDGRHREHQRELQRGHDLVAPERRHREDERDECDCDNDQVVADLHHGLLEMARRMRLFHERRGLAEEGLAARRIDDGVRLPLAEDSARIKNLAFTLGDRKRFAGERGLIDFDSIRAERPRIGRDDVAEPETHDIAGHQVPCRHVAPGPAALHTGMGREPGLQCGDGVSGLILLPEAHDRVGQKQNDNNDEVGPMMDDGREHGRRFDHPGDWSPEIRQEFQDRTGRLLRDLVGTVLGEPGLCFRQCQSRLRRSAEFLLELSDVQLLQAVDFLGVGCRVSHGVALLILSSPEHRRNSMMRNPLTMLQASCPIAQIYRLHSAYAGSKT